MSHRPRFSLVLIGSLLFAISQGQKANPGIGLTLSGGGAKGLAHIGILKAIDSAELNIDYITGTSMGSIVGGLYAAGYSGDSIEQIARRIDWNLLLSNTIPMSSYTMEEKGEFGKYAVELPFEKKKVGLPSGFLESQELWLTLERLFFPVAAINDFDKLSIPYRCIGTNLATGEVTTFKNGSIVSAIRASMAIPGVFSPVDIKGNRYVDGGVVRNFPVIDAKEMGAKYTIGVSVSTPLKNIQELDDALKVLLQVVFLSENKDRLEESKLCDYLINVPMGEFTSASFANADSIINLGIEEGRKYYPVFRHLADSLKAVYPDYTFRKNRLKPVKAYKIKNVEVSGLTKLGKDAFREQIGFDSVHAVSCERLQTDTRNAFAYRMYKSIVYEIKPNIDSTFDLAYMVKPESATMVKAGLTANSFSGFGVHLNVTSRNLLTPFSRTMFSVNLGQNFRGLFEHLQMFGYRKAFSNRFQVYSEFQDVPTFMDFRQTGLYKTKYIYLDDRFQLTAKRKSAGGLGIQWENIHASPQIETGRYYNGFNNFFSAYGFWQFNNLTKPQYPKKGTIAELKVAYVFGLHPNFDIYEDGVLIGNTNESQVPYGNYFRLTGWVNNTAPVSRSWAWSSRIQWGMNLGENESLLNNFILGGMNTTVHNQVVFAGLKEGEILSESVAAVHTGPRYNPFNNFFITLQGSLMAYDFVQKNASAPSVKWVTGSGLTLAYDLPIGPIEFTLMYTGATGGLRSYFNFGFPFKN